MFKLLFMSSIIYAAIYGTDSRREFYQLNAKQKISAQAVALSIPSHFLLKNTDGSLFHEELNEREYHDQLNLCSSERFKGQTSFGHCTAFLVAPDKLATAAHCLLPNGKIVNEPNSYCEYFSFWLGYNLSHRDGKPGAKIDPRNVVRCTKVIYAENNGELSSNIAPVDFAILQLDKPVSHVAPLKLAAQTPSFGESVYTMGHPHGLPLKHSGYSTVLQSPFASVIWSNLDTLGGNSGGPVLNRSNEVVGILIAGHQHDTYETKNRCERINRCSINAKNCKADSGFVESNEIQSIDIWRKYLL